MDYRQHLTALGIDPSTFRLDPDGTMVGGRAAAEAPPAELDGAALELGRTIGQGGMGLVREATQTAFGRAVAVKTVRPDRDSAVQRGRLFREAWVTGNVEHPNVVPAYSLGTDEEGRPAFVMRYLTGRTWTEVLEDPASHADILMGRDPLEAALDTLEQVCRAVQFAHARRIVHRDLKPDNVLLGVFGEVYLLDWGLAAGLEPGIGPLTCVDEIRDVEGTPGFMAPEMVGLDEPIGVAADVFQLGAVLHLVLTADVRFPGESIVDVLAATWECLAPTYGHDVDPLLAAIAARATTRAPGERYPSVEAFRRALMDVRDHRASRAVGAAAANRLERIRERRGEDPLALSMLAAEARSGFEEALRMWPDNHEARDGIQAVDALTTELAGRQGYLMGLEAAQDLSQNAMTKSRAAGTLSVVVPAISAAVGALDLLGWFRPSPWLIVAVTSGMAALIFGSAFTIRGKMSAADAVDTRVMLSLTGGLLALVAVSALRGLETPFLVAVLLVYSAVHIAVMSALTSPTLLQAAPLNAAAGLFALFLPGTAWFALAIASGGTFFVGSRMWRQIAAGPARGT